jgi:hypothetical protein
MIHADLKRLLAPWLVLAAVGLLSACAGPKVSGLPFFDTRTIGEGEVLEIVLPLDPAEGTSWSISSFDGALLSPIGSERVERGGQPAHLVRFRAEAPGETELRLRQNRIGKGPTYRSYKVRILD